MAEQSGLSPLDALRFGKLAFQYGMPETYASVVPSWSSIFGGGGAALEGGGVAAGSGLGAGAAGMSAATGAMMATGYGALAYMVAQLFKSLNDSTDHSVNLGSGESTGLGDLTNVWGLRPEDKDTVLRLYDVFLGDGSWREGGDPSLVGNLKTSHGLIQPMKGDDRRYYSIGGAPYESPGLAVSSGRQIAQSQMGLPVVYEDLSAFKNGVPNRDLPVYDGEAQLPHDWDARMDWAQSNFGSGEGQSGPNPGWGTISEGYGGQATTDDSGVLTQPQGALVSGYEDMAGKPRMQEWADLGMRTGEMYALTGENSPDYIDVGDVTGGPTPPGNSVVPTPAPYQPPREFSKDEMRDWLTYGTRPEQILGRPLDLKSILGG